VATKISPTARALQALEILQLQPGTTADQIGARLGVTERAARRYVAILRESGIPIESVRGRYGGYRLGRGMRLPPVTFTQDEALGLVMAVLEGHPAATGTGELAGSALAKVIRALPEHVGRQAAAVREYAAAAPDRRAAHPDPAVTSALVVAVASRQRVRVSYRSQSGREWDAEVDPWAVVVRHGRWYLLCHSHHAAAVRSYRVDRVTAVEHTGRSFSPPEELAPVAALEENLGAVQRGPRRGGAVDPAAYGTPRTTRRRHRPHRQHQQPGRVRTGVAGGHPARLPGRGRRRAAGRHGGTRRALHRRGGGPAALPAGPPPASVSATAGQHGTQD
jgi:predicted DNA-binding transcriptional regulator YafY